MPYADPEKMKEYQRNYQRQKRAGQVKQPENKPLTVEEIATAAGLRNLLAAVIAEVKASDTDIIIKARCLAYLAGVTLKACETADLEQRITMLEENRAKH